VGPFFGTMKLVGCRSIFVLAIPGGNLFGMVPRSFCKRFGFLTRSFPIQHPWPQPAVRNVIPIKELAFATIGEPNFKAPPSMDGLALDDADAI
jgi:hypothetical protein